MTHRVTTTLARRRKRRSETAPTWTVHDLADLPRLDRYRDWANLNWPAIGDALERGKAVCIAIEPDRVVAFWQYAAFRLGRPFATRYAAQHRALWLYALAGDSRECRTSSVQTADGARLAAMRMENERTRALGSVCFIVADAIDHEVDQARRGVEAKAADAMFVASRGDGFYPLVFDGPELDAYRRRVSEWIGTARRADGSNEGAELPRPLDQV